MTLTTADRIEGGYRYIPAIPPYSGGVRALEGHRIRHAILDEPVGWRDGFDRIEAMLSAAGRPWVALCAIELRCSAPHSFDGFKEFNAGYREVLAERGLLLDDGTNPIARTNVAPVVGPPEDTSLYAFSFTEVAAEVARPSFVIAGAGDLTDQADLTPEAIVRLGDRWADAAAERAAVVMGFMEARMAALGVTWRDATNVDVYCAESIHGVLADVVLGPMGPAAVHGVHWHLAAPPVRGLTYEMDLRGGVVEDRVQRVS